MGRLLDSDCGDKLASVESPIRELKSNWSAGVITGVGALPSVRNEGTLECADRQAFEITPASECLVIRRPVNVLRAVTVGAGKKVDS